MGGWRRSIISLLSAVALLASACAITSRRSAEVILSKDLQTDGLSMALNTGWNDPDFLVAMAVTDSDSTERVLQWFRLRPKPSLLIREDLGEPYSSFLGSPFVRFETSRCRVHIDFFSVVLETRSSPDVAWARSSWVLRKEDEELRDWAAVKLLNKFSQENSLPPIPWEGGIHRMTDDEARRLDPPPMVAP